MTAKYQFDIRTALQVLGWVGPPRMFFRGTLLDGRERTRAAEGLSIDLERHTYRAVSKRDAVRRLIIAGHYSRCAVHNLLPFAEQDTRGNLDWAGTDRPRTLPAKRVHEPRIRAAAIDALLTEVRAAENRADHFVELSVIKRILGRWA